MSVFGVPLEFTEIPAPAAALIYTGRAYSLAVLIEAYCNALRADAVCVVSVIPGLGACDMDCLKLRIRHMGVGHDKAVLEITGDARHIFRHSPFCNGVDDLGTIRIILLTLLKDSLPRIRFPDIRKGLLLAVRKQIEGDLLRSQAVFVISVIPDLGDRNGNVFLRRSVLRHVRVGHGEAFFSIAAHLGCVAFRYFFPDGVSDVVSFGICLIHRRECALPVA